MQPNVDMASYTPYPALPGHQSPDQIAIQESNISPLSRHFPLVQDSGAPQADNEEFGPRGEPPGGTHAIRDADTQSQDSVITPTNHAGIESHLELQSTYGTSTLLPSQSSIPTQSEMRLAIKESIGTYGLLVLALGALASLASLGFIIFLWAGKGSSPGAIDASPSWRAIIIGGWITQATTLAAILIRTAAATQATVCTAMLSALFLERQYVPKLEAPQFSILRTVNDGPLKLAQLIFKPKQLSRMLCIETALVFALVVSTLFLQFTSTILFSDLHESEIAADRASFPVNDYIAQHVDGLYSIDVSQLPPTNAVFGELSSNRTSDPDSLGFSNAGPLKRAFIPLREANMRTAIHSYSGNAATLSSNVACMRPNMQSTYHGDQQGTNLNPTTYDFGRINGTLHYGESLQKAHSVTSLCDLKGCLNSRFQCNLPGSYESHPGWSSSLCLIGAVDGYWPRGMSLEWDSDSQPWSNHSLVYLLFATNMYTSDWNSSHSPRTLEASPVTNFGEWKSYEIKQDRFINVTLCFSTFHAELKSVDMVATGNLVEPLGNWSATGIGDSSKVRKYLGVSEKNSTLADRGLLTIRNIQEPQRLSPLEASGDDLTVSLDSNRTLAERAASDYEDGIYSHLTFSGTPSFTFQACTLCDFVGDIQHPELASIIQDTINETRRAADAIQAYTTSVANTFYNEFLKSFTGAEQVQIAFTKTVQTAGEKGCRGLISVATFVFFHLICVALTAFTYVKLTRYSRQGNTWHTISQLLGPELNEMLERGDNVDDSAFAKEARGKGEDVLVRLERTKSGRIGLVRAQEESKLIYTNAIAGDEAVPDDRG
ncbi:hypothetical protein F4803DRAFT_555472 [Xylaria telfairii]|nr:hypothetical protein F4803DRAFT_555472 [Xylaria telfairii]